MSCPVLAFRTKLPAGAKSPAVSCPVPVAANLLVLRTGDAVCGR